MFASYGRRCVSKLRPHRRDSPEILSVLKKVANTLGCLISKHSRHRRLFAMGMTPLLPKMACLGFIKKSYHVASDDLVWDPQTSSGPRETVKLWGFYEIHQKSRSSSTFVTLVHHFRKVVETFRRSILSRSMSSLDSRSSFFQTPKKAWSRWSR